MYRTITKTIILYIFITLAAYSGWLIKQINIIITFLSMNLNFMIYLKLPIGYSPKGKVAKILKILYNFE